MLGMDWQPAPPGTGVEPQYLQVVDYEKTQQQVDPTSAPVKQAKVSMDAAIATANMEQLHIVFQQIGQLIPQDAMPLLMHAFRSAAAQGNIDIMKFVLAQTGSCNPEQLYELMKYGLDGAATQTSPQMMDFLLGAVGEAFQSKFPQQLLELLQYAVGTTATKGNLVLLKFLMDHTAAAAIPVNYDDVFLRAVRAGHAETLLKDAIQGGGQYENVILMLLHSVKLLPDNNESHVGSRQSFKSTAKLHLVKCYKQKDPQLFEKLMAVVKSYFPEEARSQSNGDAAMAM